MTVRDIIKACGGAPAIAEEIRRLRELEPESYPLAGVKAVYQWVHNGIPQWHWPVVMQLSGQTEREILRANQELKKSAPADKASRPTTSTARRSSTRFAA
jgi:hypothetical protein